MKRLFSIIFATLLVGQTWAYDFAAECASGHTLYYKITSDTTVDVTYPYFYGSGDFYYGYTKPSGDLVIPETVTYNEVTYYVTGIGYSAFNNCIGLNSVTIPNSVTDIASSAFSGCSGLTYNEYDNAFYLGNDENPYLGLIKAKSTYITSCDIYDGCKYICESAFSGCNYLKSITIPNSVVSIGYAAFEYCRGLTNVIVPNSITSISERIFRGCSDLTFVTIPNTITTIGGGAFSGCTNLKSVAIPNSVTSIGPEAFHSCSSLTTVSIPNSVKSIGWGTFSNCTSLTSVFIPNSVKSIDRDAFHSCSNATFYCEMLSKPIGWSSEWNYYENVLWGRKGPIVADDYMYVIIIDSISPKVELNKYMGSASSVVIPTNVVLDGIKYPITSIRKDAFKNTTNFTSVTIESDVDASNSYLYFIKDGIRYKVLNKNTVEVAFNNYSGEVAIPASVIAGNKFSVIGIGEGAFKNSSNLTSITIPNSVTYIGIGAFSGCDKLDYNIYDNGCYIGNEENPYLVLLMAKRQTITECEINSNCKVIYDYAFSGCNSLASISIPESVTCIGIGVFYNCIGLTKAEFASIKSLCEIRYSQTSNLFSYSRYLYIGGKETTNLVIPNTVTSISDYAFFNCNCISSVTIPNSVVTIGDCAFYGCGKLKTIIIPKSVTTIGESAFNNNSDPMSVSEVTFYCEPESKPDGWYYEQNENVWGEHNSWNGMDHKGTIIWNIKAKLSDDYIFNVISDSDPRQVGIYKYMGDGEVTIPANVTLDGVEYQVVTINNKAFAKSNSNGYNYAGNYLKLKRIVCSSETPIKLDEDPFPQNDTVYVPVNSVKAYQNAFVWKRKEILPIALYEVKAKANTEGGSIIGMGSFAKGTSATLTATPAEGYHFVKWSDGNTENPRTIIVNGNLELTAIFETDENQGGENQGGENTNPGTAVAESAANAINIYAHGNTIIVENATDEIRVYNATGALVGRDVACRVRAELQVNGAGVYIVKVGNVAKRVMVY